MTALVRRLARLALLAGLAAWILDRWLGQQRGAARPDPIRTTIRIDAPIERVWAILADLEGQPTWMHDLKAVRLASSDPVAVGTQAVGRVQVFGLAIDDRVEVTAFDAPTHFAIRHDGLVGGNGDIRLASETDGSTTVTWVETLVPPVLPDLGVLVLGLVFRPIFQRDLGRLAALVEAG